MQHNSTTDSFFDVPMLIHIGPHKTGTTWLQKTLFSRAQGIIYESCVELSHHSFLHPRIEDFSVDFARGFFAPILARAREERKPLVISDEALGGRPFGQRFLREIAAERIARTFPHARILITTREQNAILLSMYGEYLRYGYSSSLHAFLCQETGNPALQPVLDLAYYEWDRLAQLYESLFPREQILVLPMEWGLRDPRNYPAEVERLLGTPLNISSSPNTKEVERAALSGWALEILRHANKLHPQDTRYLSRGGRFSPNSLGYQVDRLTPAFARTRSKQRMRKVVQDQVGNRFAASNRRFQDMTNFCLVDLGYRVDESQDD